MVNTATYSPLKGVGTVTSATVNQDVSGVSAGWWHNWIPSAWGSAAPGFVPTIWNGSYIGWPVPTAGGPLLTFNEPNGPLAEGGTALSPEAAAALWPALMATYPNHGLIAPTVRTQTHGDYPTWQDWLGRWWNALTPAGRARVTAVSLNCYADTATCQALVTAVRQWGRDRGIAGSVWLKEFFDPAFVPWLEGQGVYYGWFVARVPDDREPTSVWGRALFDDAGLTYWGRTYRALP